MSKGRDKKTVGVSKITLGVDNIYAARDAAIAGLGSIPLPPGLCQQELADHRLERILSEWDISTIPLNAIWNNKARRNSLTRRLITFLTDSSE